MRIMMAVALKQANMPIYLAVNGDCPGMLQQGDAAAGFARAGRFGSDPAPSVAAVTETA